MSLHRKQSSHVQAKYCKKLKQKIMRLRRRNLMTRCRAGKAVFSAAGESCDPTDEQKVEKLPIWWMDLRLNQTNVEENETRIQTVVFHLTPQNSSGDGNWNLVQSKKTQPSFSTFFLYLCEWCPKANAIKTSSILPQAPPSFLSHLTKITFLFGLNYSKYGFIEINPRF